MFNNYVYYYFIINFIFKRVIKLLFKEKCVAIIFHFKIENVNFSGLVNVLKNNIHG